MGDGDGRRTGKLDRVGNDDGDDVVLERVGVDVDLSEPGRRNSFSQGKRGMPGVRRANRGERV